MINDNSSENLIWCIYFG